jgi:UDP-glucuronate 4-epimerase
LSTALVTGAAGFIPNALCKELLKNGYKVVGVDNLFRGREEALPKSPNFKFYNADLLEEKNAVSIVEKEKPELIFHYAAVNGTKYFYERPWFVLASNVQLARKPGNPDPRNGAHRAHFTNGPEQLFDFKSC